MRVLIVILFLSLSSTAVAETIPCWKNPDTIPETKQIAVLKTHLLPINLETPEQDLKERVSHEDYRFIAIGSFGIDYPGLNNKELLCTYGFRYITGTSDALESKEHGSLIQAFKGYAVKYNTKLEGMLSGK
ncbi:hypothetical protein CWB99_23545 [Pseudoalteromonas rubra]|uniref:Uncharacterized protein n=1 Tax=Pseudoalteromonas rubra TaxID=43658 RepID=A0A5S3WEV4_9GAMM|nr:hypothetical protein [Pseudoalteromonas rubra]TMP23090.1 hypothetical protein CWB99_23545 [Pseudoalteromonas rubra]TMP26804.1 hypothetical protein CWC00_23800 [Pseudoalteromonas rubra]